jgi:hypothetical protein
VAAADSGPAPLVKHFQGPLAEAGYPARDPPGRLCSWPTAPAEWPAGPAQALKVRSLTHVAFDAVRTVRVHVVHTPYHQGQHMRLWKEDRLMCCPTPNPTYHPLPNLSSLTQPIIPNPTYQRSHSQHFLPQPRFADVGFRGYAMELLEHPATSQNQIRWTRLPLGGTHAPCSAEEANAITHICPNPCRGGPMRYHAFPCTAVSMSSCCADTLKQWPITR